MNGQDVYKHACDRMTEAARDVLGDRPLDEIDLVVAHQANARIVRTVAQRLGLQDEQVVDTIAGYGNNSSASIPIALADGCRSGRLQDGMRPARRAFGAGFSWGAVRWCDVGRLMRTGRARHRCVARYRTRHRAAARRRWRPRRRELPSDAEGAKETVAAIEAPADARSSRPVTFRRPRVSTKRSRQPRKPVTVLVLVNNAGTRATGSLPMMKHEDWDAVIQTNLTGAFLTSQARAQADDQHALGTHREHRVRRRCAGQRRAGELRGGEGRLIGLTRSLALEVAKRGITVNAVAPGLVRTAMTDELAEHFDELMKQTPIARAVEAEEIAAAVGVPRVRRSGRRSRDRCCVSMAA